MYEWERGLCSHVGKSMLKWIYSVKPSPSFCLSWSYFLRWHQQCEVLSFSVLCNLPADSFSFIQPAHWWIHCRNISSVSCRLTSPHLLTAWRPVRTTLHVTECLVWLLIHHWNSASPDSLTEKADKGAVTDKGADKGADAAEKGADPVDKGRVDCLHEAFSSISKLFPWNHRHSPQTVQCSMQVD